MKKNSLGVKVLISILDAISNTWRIEVNSENPVSEKGILVFWHGYMLPVWKYFGARNPYAVVSLSSDGEILSSVLHKWGFGLIRGSSSNKGKEVLNEIILKADENLILMTPDGPGGPAMEMKAGAVIAAARANVPLFLCGVMIKGKYIFSKSWDLFQLPLPFTKIELILKGPFYVENTDDREEFENKILELQTKLILLYT
ncbi:MAG: DUF374 domain-containing protein [Candidatus Kapaibacterium sp.]